MKETALISIIVNCFNGERYLKDALNSVLNQTYKNWEIIFWDNQSKDNSAKVFKSFTDKRFKYFYASEHTVLYKARNEAIKKASGNILAFLDVDDWWTADKLKKQVSLFENKSVGLVYSNFYLFYEENKKKKVFNKKNLKSGYICKDLLKNYNIGILTVLLKREAYDSVSGFNDHSKFSGDFDLIVRLSALWKFDCIQDPLAYYRIHDNNFYNTHNKNNVIEIQELESWIINDRITSNKSLKPYLHYVSKRINFLKTIKYINEGKLKQAIKSIFLFPAGLQKIKLLFYFLLPKIILKKIRRL